MNGPNSTWKAILAGLVTLFAVFAFRSILKPDPSQLPTPMPKVGVDFRLLAQAAASPGKVIPAVKDGRVLASYTCTPQDGAIAWLYDYASTQTVQGSVVVGAPVPGYGYVDGGPVVADGRGRPLPDWVQQKGPLKLVVIPRGYATKPAGVRVLVADGLTPDSFETIPISAFAEPIQCLAKPSVDETASAEESLGLTAVCEVIDGESDWIQLQDRQHRDVGGRIIRSSFCPEGLFDPRNYGRETDAVEVLTEDRKEVDSFETLTYRNAQISDVNGIRALRLPTTQVVGHVLDATATIQKLMPFSNQRPGHASANGDMFIRLDRKTHPRRDGIPTAEVDGISPSVDELGLDLLRLRIGDSGTGVDLVGTRGIHRIGPHTIPVLTIKIRIRNWVIQKSKRYVLAVHHVHRPKPPPVPRVAGFGQPMPGPGPGNGALPSTFPQMLVPKRRMASSIPVYLVDDPAFNGKVGDFGEQASYQR
ncbi:MAG: hypothetical protein P4L46_15125 [Fimbriimonas sp.]|nr:hypothetical protein [Fimbriimonas sp.]